MLGCKATKSQVKQRGDQVVAKRARGDHPEGHSRERCRAHHRQLPGDAKPPPEKRACRLCAVNAAAAAAAATRGSGLIAGVRHFARHSAAGTYWCPNCLQGLLGDETRLARLKDDVDKVERGVAHGCDGGLGAGDGQVAGLFAGAGGNADGGAVDASVSAAAAAAAARLRAALPSLFRQACHCRACPANAARLHRGGACLCPPQPGRRSLTWRECGAAACRAEHPHYAGLDFCDACRERRRECQCRP